MLAQLDFLEDLFEYFVRHHGQFTAPVAERRILPALPHEASCLPGGLRSGCGPAKLLGSAAGWEFSAGQGSLAVAVSDFSGNPAAPLERNSHVRPVDCAQHRGSVGLRCRSLPVHRPRRFAVSCGILLFFGRLTSFRSPLDTGTLSGGSTAGNL